LADRIDLGVGEDEAQFIEIPFEDNVELPKRMARIASLFEILRMAGEFAIDKFIEEKLNIELNNYLSDVNRSIPVGQGVAIELRIAKHPDGGTVVPRGILLKPLGIAKDPGDVLAQRARYDADAKDDVPPAPPAAAAQFKLIWVEKTDRGLVARVHPALSYGEFRKFGREDGARRKLEDRMSEGNLHRVLEKAILADKWETILKRNKQKLKSFEEAERLNKINSQMKSLQGDLRRALVDHERMREEMADVANRAAMLDKIGTVLSIVSTAIQANQMSSQRGKIDTLTGKVENLSKESQALRAEVETSNQMIQDLRQQIKIQGEEYKKLNDRLNEGMRSNGIEDQLPSEEFLG